MNANLKNMVDQIIAGDSAKAAESFHAYRTAKLSEMYDKKDEYKKDEDKKDEDKKDEDKKDEDKACDDCEKCPCVCDHDEDKKDDDKNDDDKKDEDKKDD